MNPRQPNEQDIRRMLTELHNEISQTDTFDEDQRVMMRHLMNDLQDVLNRTESKNQVSAYQHKTLTDRLEESVAALEVTHPTLAAMLQKAFETLSNAGI